MKGSTRNPVVLGLTLALVAVAIVGLTGASASAAHGVMFALIAGGVLYMIWPELRAGRRPHS